MSSEGTRNCVLNFRKYADTVAISFAIFHMFDEDPSLGRFIGEEHKLTTASGNKLTPDLTVVYDNNSKGLLFELKYLLPQAIRSVKERILEVKKYQLAKYGWKTPNGTVNAHDVVLVCHIEDVKRAKQAIDELSLEPEGEFFKSEGFALWTWTIVASREDERREELRLQRVHGNTRNMKLEEKINDPGGIPIPEDVLRFLRFSLPFIRDKPPVQYTIAILIQTVFTFLHFPHRTGKQFFDIDLDVIYNACNSLFPPWWESDVETVQVKRLWVREAMDTLTALKITKPVPSRPDSYSIPIPTLKTRKPLHQALCELLESLRRKGKRGRPPKIKPVRKARPAQTPPLTNFFQK